ncbi:hypothetical protein GWO43_29850 [candidate division KSB1 bacterium]|nr:hypothetical protein [candidate division KSB1 bacterium]NIR73231.1 hypothetical protein [candidate division KSB1 bacterium]NIS28346.1 hypothetical protein [candidate division KSB1 bacterium]NIT74989.1 hypothetical protein [candidate division KSB1 bacterium]NIU29078.1 hypothetical protein [candidate division KSB1 bacterium]
MTRFQQFVAEAVQDKSSPREKIESYIDAAIEFFEKHRPIFSILVLERHNLSRSLNGEMCNDCLKHQETILQFLAKLFREGIRSGMFKKLDPTKLAQVLFAMLHDAYRHAVMEPTTTNLKKDAGIIKQIYFEGITI